MSHGHAQGRRFSECERRAAAMRLVMDPQSFDVLVMENLFGDILSDLTSGLVGGLGVTPSANVGDVLAVHGTAPDIAGRGLANPTALILSGVLMLRFLREKEAADRVEAAVRAVLGRGETLTGDLGGRASTQEFSQAVISVLEFRD
ncbi:MAG: isocitrate/isopropylmalate family dehydrogenase [Thermoguttaceae bacterium]